jgi:hypothetical protein
MRMRLLVGLSLLVATTGCSAVVGSATEADAQSSATSVTGVVVVDRSVGDELSHAETSARFIRLHGAIDDSALELVGAGLDLPPVGQCAARSDQARTTGTRPVELLDVGAVSIEALATGQRTVLASRQVPDVVDLVSGTMYSARVDEVSVPSASNVAVLVSGSADFPAFSVRAKTPEVPAGVHVVAVDAATVEISWSLGVGAAPSDGAYADVGTRLRCSFADDGRAVIPASDGDVIALHRVQREKLSIAGLAAGELRFDFARVVTFRH